MSSLRILINATFTADPLAAPLEFLLDQLHLDATVELGPYNQVFQQLLDPTSQLHANRLGVNLLLIRPEDWGAPAKRETIASELAAAVKSAADSGAGAFLVCLCPASVAALADPTEAAQYTAIETLLRGQWAGSPAIHFIAPNETLAAYPIAGYDDPAANRLGHVPYTRDFFHALALLAARRIYRLRGTPHKVLVLDCDNTLWKGVCGEGEGASALEITAPFLAVQQYAIDQHKAGVVICLCSKNNEADVDAVFDTRSDMLLTREHVVSHRINWQPKSMNIRSLAEELNLGLDSFVFIDDDNAVCAEVRANCPEVLVFQLPHNLDEIPAALGNLWAFDRTSVTAEDLKRSEMYKQNVERERIRKDSMDLAGFLAGLGLEIKLQPMEEAQLARVSQLTQRTNQFNATTIRRTEPDVRQFLDAGGECITVNVSDRFGDYGLVGALLYNFIDGRLNVDSFLLSCRALGRGVEHKMVSRMGEIAVERNLASVDLRFIPTKKNAPALDFLTSLNVPPIENADGSRIYRLESHSAAQVKLDTQAPPKPAVQEESKKATPAQNAAGRAAGLARIALELYDAKRLAAAVAASHTRQSTGAREGFVEPANEAEKQLAALWEQVLGIQPVGAEDDYFALGGDSLKAVELFSAIERQTGHPFSMATLFQARTVRQQAALISGAATAPNWISLVPIQPNGSKPPLYCMHAAGGNVLFYGDLARHLGPDQPVYGLQAQGMDGKHPRHNRVEDMARHYIVEIRSFQPEGPYSVCGSSFGGLVAYEVARQLRAQGQEVAFAGLFDTYGQGYPKYPAGTSNFQRNMFRLVRRVQHHARSISLLSGAERWAYIRAKSAKAVKLFRRDIKKRKNDIAASFYESTGRALPTNLLKTQDAIMEALKSYTYPPYEGDIVLFRAKTQPLGIIPEPELGWRPLVKGQLEIHEVPGTHGAVTVDPHAPFLAEKMIPCLERARAGRREPTTV